MRVLILANGEAPSQELAQRLAGEHDLLIATDGAAHRAAGLELSLDVVCGDFDSVVMEVARQEYPNTEFAPTPDQDFADLEKAILVALERGATHITVIGAMGGRLDFTLANAALLLRYYDSADIQIVDDATVIRAVGSETDATAEVSFPVCPGERVSLLSLSGKARVSISGVAWPLDDHLLPIGTHGISNVAEQDRVMVRVRHGVVLVFHFPDSAE